MDERSRRAEHVYRHGCVGNSNGVSTCPTDHLGEEASGEDSE
jgi:hypothetical protein